MAIIYGGTSATILSKMHGSDRSIDSRGASGETVRTPLSEKPVNAQAKHILDSPTGKGALGDRTTMAKWVRTVPRLQIIRNNLVERPRAENRPRSRGRELSDERISQRRTLAYHTLVGAATGATGHVVNCAFAALQAQADVERGLASFFIDSRVLVAPSDLGRDRAAALVVSGLEEMLRLRNRGFDDFGGGENANKFDGVVLLIASPSPQDK